MNAVRLPRCTDLQTRILQLRADGKTYREVTRHVGLSPRKVRDQEVAALRKLIDFAERSAFLEGLQSFNR